MRVETSEHHVHGARSSKQLSKATWPDFERFFAANNGVWGGCWCMYYHQSEKWDVKDYEGHKRAKRSLVKQGHAHGTIVYCGDDPVGWCQFGPKEELLRVDRKKGYTPTSKDAWRITCFFISRHHRKMGFAELAVRESVKTMKDLGVKDIEAYPVEGRLSASLLWSGTPELFEGAGFSRVRPLGKSSWIYSLKTA
jgi:hypothetical protein